MNQCPCQRRNALSKMLPSVQRMSPMLTWLMRHVGNNRMKRTMVMILFFIAVLFLVWFEQYHMLFVSQRDRVREEGMVGEAPHGRLG